jgi:integrase
MAKRGTNEGSIFQLPDGRWRATVSLGFRNGKRWRKSFEASTFEEVQQKVTVAKRDHQLGFNIAPERQAVGDFLHNWLQMVKSDIGPATYVSYEGLVRLHLLPALGKIALSKLRAGHIEQFKALKLGSDLSPRTVQYCLHVLRMALTKACALELVPRNVAMLVEYPQVPHEEMRPFTPDEARQFLAVAKDDRFGALFSVALALGLRRGEALGLQWPDIDFISGTLRVNRALQRLKIPGDKKGMLMLVEPKRGSRRAINLPRITITALLAHRAQQEQERQFAGTRWQEKNFVFTTKIGTALEPRKVNTEFCRLSEKAGLPRIRVHDLRHTCASLLLAQSVPYKEIQEILGHSDIRVTMNLYAHLYPEAKREAADRMDALLSPVAQFVAQSAEITKPN